MSESRFRAACDRCHELKNRCARRQDTDSRCERCERLEYDCVYSTGARMGRPPGPQTKQQSNTVQRSNDQHGTKINKSGKAATLQQSSDRRILKDGGTQDQKRRGSEASSSSQSWAGSQNRPEAPVAKRHRHHQRRHRAHSSGVSVSSSYPSSSEAMDLIGTGMAPQETTSSSSSSVIQGSSTLISPLQSSARSWLEAQHTVPETRTMDWDQHMTSFAPNHPGIHWPNDVPHGYESVFSEILDSNDGLNSAQTDVSMMFQKPANDSMVFPDTEPRKQDRANNGLGLPLLDDTGHRSSPLDKLMKLHDELRDLAASQVFQSTGSAPEDQSSSRSNHKSDSRSRLRDDEALEASLLLLNIVQDLVMPQSPSGVTSSNDSDPNCDSQVTGNSSYRGLELFPRDVAPVRAPAFHTGATTTSQTAMLQEDQIQNQERQSGRKTTREGGQEVENYGRTNMREGSGQHEATETMTMPFQIGCVSLELHPMLNAELTMYALTRIVQRLHGLINLFAFGRTDMRNDTDDHQQRPRSSSVHRSSRKMYDPSGQFAGGAGLTSPVIIAAQAVMNAVYEKETALVARMETVINSQVLL